MFGWIWLIAALFLAGLGAEELLRTYWVPGGVALGAAWLLAVDLAAGWWYERRHPKTEHPEEKR